MKIILVTGGAGYIGSHVVKELHKKGYKAVIFDNLSRGNKFALKWGDFVFGDLNNISSIRKAFSDYSFDAVMHFASYAYVGESMENPQRYYQNNVVTTLNLLSCMLEFNVKKIIFSSSCATYGIPQRIPITESHYQNPINPYGQTKLIIEKILLDFNNAYDLKYVSLRYFNAAGADPDCEIGECHIPETHLIPLVLDAALNEKKHIKVFGTDYPTKDGTCIRDYIHVTDLANAHLLSLEYLLDGNVSDIFNLGNNAGFSVREVIDTAMMVTKQKIDFISEKRRDGDPPILVGSADKIKDILRWEPKFNCLQDIIKTAWKWHLKTYK